MRGSAVLYNLGNGKPAEKSSKKMLRSCFLLTKAVLRQSYPTSLAGSIALLRQFYLDAEIGMKKEEMQWRKSKFRSI